MKVALVAIGLASAGINSSAIAKITIDGVQPDASNDHYLMYVRHLTVPFYYQTGATWDAGNDVTGKTPAEVQAIVDAIKALFTGVNLQLQIYDEMNAAPTEVFAFSSLAHAKAAVKQRIYIIDMMNNFNNDGRYTYHDKTHPPNTTASSWVTGSPILSYFRQNSSTAHEAITQLCDAQTQTYGECLGAMFACVWWGSFQGMGMADFDTLYPGSTALNMNQKASGNTSMFRNLANPIDTAVYIPGDAIYVKNFNYGEVIHHPAILKSDWLDHTRPYFLTGENAFYMGKDFGDTPRWEGLGLDFDNLKIGDLKAKLMVGYNADLAKVIDAAAELGGTFQGLEIEAITINDLDAKIQIDGLLRPTIP